MAPSQKIDKIIFGDWTVPRVTRSDSGEDFEDVHIPARRRESPMENDTSDYFQEGP